MKYFLLLCLLVTLGTGYVIYLDYQSLKIEGKALRIGQHRIQMQAVEVQREK